MQDQTFKDIIIRLMAEVISLKAECYANRIGILGIQQEMYKSASGQQLASLNNEIYMEYINRKMNDEWFNSEFKDQISQWLLALIEEQKA